MTEPTPTSVCPVHLAGLQIRDLCATHGAAESHAFVAFRSGDEIEYKVRADAASRIYWGLVGVQQATAFLRTESALGALLQLGLISDEAEHLHSLLYSSTGFDEADAERTFDAIRQMAYSVTAFIERTCGVSREDIGADAYLPHSHDSLKPSAS